MHEDIWVRNLILHCTETLYGTEQLDILVRIFFFNIFSLPGICYKKDKDSLCWKIYLTHLNACYGAVHDVTGSEVSSEKDKHHQIIHT